MASALLTDTHNRPLRDLRISVTDRCNFRCRYCMPAEIFGSGYQFLPRQEILRFSEIETIARNCVALGVRKLRLTGGEPLMRRDLPVLVKMLASIDDVEDLAMTTNGALLTRHAQTLKDAGLHRVTVSLDALDAELFGKMNGVGASPQHVIDGIDAALNVGLGLKLNAVIQKGVNENQIIPLAEFAQQRGIPIRYIEFMDTGTSNGWKLEQVISSAQVLEALLTQFPLEPLPEQIKGATAKRYGLEDQHGFEVGFISSVTQPFCAACNRIRLSADGHFYTCLFANHGYDIKSPLRAGESPEQLQARISTLWHNRSDNYSEQRSANTSPKDKIEMSYIGG